MGIDIYAEWGDESFHDRADREVGRPDYKADRETAKKQSALIYSGANGYLRESYHGRPYATREFVREAFEAKDATARIPASVLMGRLEKAAADTIQRYREVYDCEPRSEETLWQMRQFADFARKVAEIERETGVTPNIIASY